MFQIKLYNVFYKLKDESVMNELFILGVNQTQVEHYFYQNHYESNDLKYIEIREANEKIDWGLFMKIKGWL